MANFDIAVAKTLIKEGGSKLTIDKDDHGGATRYGISSAAYPNVDIRNLTEQQARDIYKRDYWDKICGDEITDQKMAESIFDTAVNIGVTAVVKMVQRIICADSIDGIFGSKTLLAVNLFIMPEPFIYKLAIQKVNYYSMIVHNHPEQARFVCGWLARTTEGL